MTDSGKVAGKGRERGAACPPRVEFRPPSAREIDKRVRDFMWWVGVIAYLIFGFGGLAVFEHFVHDADWREIFLSVWWLPSGAAAFWVMITIENHLVGWVPDAPPWEDEE